MRPSYFSPIWSAAALALLFAACRCPAQIGAPPTPLNEYQVVTTEPDGSGLAVARCAQLGKRNDCAEALESLPVRDPGQQAIVRNLNPGDHIFVDPEGGGFRSIRIMRKSLSPRDRPTSFRRELATFAGWATLLWLIALGLTRGHVTMLVVGMDNRYSNSKFQLALWFWVLISSYLTVLSMRVSACGWDFLGGVNIPQNLALLSGFSALTFGGAKAITTRKSNAAADDALQTARQNAGARDAAVDAVAGAVIAEDPGGAAAGMAVLAEPAGMKSSVGGMKMAPKGSENFWRDLVQNDRQEFDFGDFQMLIVTLLAVGTYVVLLFHYLDYFPLRAQVSLPDVDTTILTTFGIGQGAYLTKKAAGNLGTS